VSKLTGKIAVVTGGSAGIGQGIAARFVAEGAQVFITGRNRARLDKAVAEIGGNVSAVQGDASNLTDIDRIYQTVREKAGRIDVLVVNAGFYESGTLGEITEEHFDKTFDTNVRGVLFAVQKALPLLVKGSSVILIGSVASIKGFPSFSVYDATKAAVRSFARGWILDLKGRDILSSATSDAAASAISSAGTHPSLPVLPAAPTRRPTPSARPRSGFCIRQKRREESRAASFRGRAALPPRPRSSHRPSARPASSKLWLRPGRSGALRRGASGARS
jgi:NAD(P)-dependent dehydrogenase (short-subunit alcohol dehydrogenase family)